MSDLRSNSFTSYALYIIEKGSNDVMGRCKKEYLWNGKKRRNKRIDLWKKNVLTYICAGDGVGLDFDEEREPHKLVSRSSSASPLYN